VSFFAVIAEDGVPPLTLKELHVNLWSLGALFRRIFVCDIGLLVEAAAGQPVTKVTIVLPFSVYADETRDLFDVLQVREVAVLVFGEPVAICQPATAEPTISIKTGADKIEYPLKRLQIHNATFEEIRHQAIATLCSIPLDVPIQAGSMGYLRLRFRVKKRGRTWQWRRQVFGVRRALVDIRVNDVRESVKQQKLLDIERRIVPMPPNALHVFVTADWQFQMRVASPYQPRIRILEGRVWERYLNRAPDFFRRAKMVIYHWFNENPVDAVNPFRIFLDLSTDESIEGWRYVVLQFLIVATALWIAVGGGASRLGNAGRAIAAGFGSIPVGLNGYGSVVGAMFIAGGIIAVAPPLRRATSLVWLSLGRVVRALEDRVLYAARG